MFGSLAPLGLLGLTSACVLGEPDFTPPARTRPELIAFSHPTTELIKLVKPDASNFDPVEFVAVAFSEDAGDDLKAVLLENYGVPDPMALGQPYERVADQQTVQPQAAGVAKDVSLSWSPFIRNGTHDCKSVTMVLTHQLFDNAPYADCPADGNDAATLTWFVALCENLGDCTFEDCAAKEPEEGYCYCPTNPDPAVRECAR
jgi:hypothetical protein